MDSIIDSHLHLWDTTKFDYSWITNNETIHKTFLSSDFLAQTSPLNIEGVVLIEAVTDSWKKYGMEEVNFFISSLQAIPVKAIVAVAPIELGFEGQFWYDGLKKYELVKGVRQVIQGEIDDFCLNPKFKEGIILASNDLTKILRNGYSVDICIKGDKQLENIISVIQSLPSNITIIIDHIAKPFIDKQIFDPWKELISRLSNYPNVYCKISGVITEAKPDWTKDEIKPYIEHAIHVFGKDRILYGSDCPVSLLHSSSYDIWLNTLLEIINESFTIEERKKLFNLNARHVYRF